MGQDYLADYRRDGYAVIRGLFDAAEVAAIAAAFDRIYAQGMALGSSFRHQNVFYRIGRDAQLGQIVRLVQWPSYFDQELDAVRLDRRMLAVVAPLLGRDLKQIINQLHWKPPGARNVEFGYHQDIRFRRPRAAYRHPAEAYVQTGLAIDRHGADNGAMTFFPGSHRLGELVIRSEGGAVMEQPMNDADVAQAGLDPADKRVLELAPGDLAIWNLYTVHGSGPNAAACDRRLYINGYVRAADCDRGEWAFRDGRPCPLGEPALVHYEDLHRRPEPHFIEER